MPLTAGTRLGPYEILAPLGAGGMSEVYKSRDTRFDREARAVAALNPSAHQHAIRRRPELPRHGAHRGSPLEGPLPIEQALRYAAQICSARGKGIFLKAARVTPGLLAWGDTLDGQRFLMVEPAKAQAVQSLTVLFNWQEALRR